jgi:uncharacterized membrane-anchored protein YhcB (DUF1043 family)
MMPWKRRRLERERRAARHLERVEILRKQATEQRAALNAESQHITSVLLHMTEVMNIVRRDCQQIRQHTAASAGLLSNLEHAMSSTSRRVTDLSTACRFIEIRPSAGVTVRDPLEFP